MEPRQTFSFTLPPEYREKPSDVSKIAGWCEDRGMDLKDFTYLSFAEQRAIAIGQLGLDVDRLIAAVAWANGFQKAINRGFWIAMTGSPETPPGFRMV